MENEQKFVIMTVGKTHSGKTTFARKLGEKLPEYIHLEGDPVHMFVLQNFPSVWMVEKEREACDLSNPMLKHRLLNEILTTMLERGHSIILSTSNLRRDIRTFLIQESHKYGASVLMVYFNISIQTLRERARSTLKPRYFLSQSKNFEELLERQQLLWFEEPWIDEADAYFEIRDESETSAIIERIIALVKNGRT